MPATIGRREQLTAARRARRESAAAAAWLALASAALGSVLGVLGSNLFKIEKVHIACPEPSLAQEAALQAGKLAYGNVWLPPTHAIERTIGGLPRAKAARLYRDLPRTLVIAVRPREPAATLTHQGRFMLVDEEGVCLTWTGLPPEDLPTVANGEWAGLSVGSTIASDQAVLLGQVLRGLREVGLTAGARIELSNPRLVRVWAADGALGKLGDARLLEEKTVLFGKLLKALRERGEQPLYIDVRVPSQPTYKSAAL
jgi:cell division septal protein FtsQ